MQHRLFDWNGDEKATHHAVFFIVAVVPLPLLPFLSLLLFPLLLPTPAPRGCGSWGSRHRGVRCVLSLGQNLRRFVEIAPSPTKYREIPTAVVESHALEPVEFLCMPKEQQAVFCSVRRLEVHLLHITTPLEVLVAKDGEEAFVQSLLQLLPVPRTLRRLPSPLHPRRSHRDIRRIPSPLSLPCQVKVKVSVPFTLLHLCSSTEPEPR
mmetsp:Transcript_37639/g.69431  ORF Transcript_37639/g.69431 Transcript_37639/m.69431 type:complete len:208 (-) Transcript_37639:957-1580(-)